jgi:hypothetical protein
MTDQLRPTPLNAAQIKEALQRVDMGVRELASYGDWDLIEDKIAEGDGALGLLWLSLEILFDSDLEQMQLYIAADPKDVVVDGDTLKYVGSPVFR